MNEPGQYDLAIAGGGLAGLALSIQVAKQGHKVIVFEKENYPFHRVCGEYISLESWDFLQKLGLDLAFRDLPMIKKIILSASNGKSLQQKLPLGGFGMSRYILDHELAKLAMNNGVEIMENTRVNDLNYSNDEFLIDSSAGNFRARVAVGCFGKRSNLDVKWKRQFVLAKKNNLNNYVGIKYHVRTDLPADTIALHHFKNGYCGISKVEGDKYCLCYLTTAASLQDNQKDIHQLEQNVLSVNPHLKNIFLNAERLWTEPVVISQISFDKKSQSEDHVLMIGDAAGMITPLCGNGMSMALHGSKIAAKYILQFLPGKITRNEMEEKYKSAWAEEFSGRLKTGRIVQRLFTNDWMSKALVQTGRIFPFMIRAIIRRTHGKTF